MATPDNDRGIELTVLKFVLAIGLIDAVLVVKGVVRCCRVDELTPLTQKITLLIPKSPVFTFITAIATLTKSTSLNEVCSIGYGSCGCFIEFIASVERVRST